MSMETKILRRNIEKYLEAKVDGEMVLMHLDTAAYFGMDKTTTHIWELLEDRMSLDQLVGKLTTLYDVDAETCKSDILPVVQDMIEKEFLIPN